MKIYRKANNQKSIVQIARDVLRRSEYDVTGRCLTISREFRDELIRNGYGNAIVVGGEFRIDEPDLANYEDWEDDDFDSEEEMDEARHWALHYWVELNGGIIDITASQFNNEIDDKMPKIVIGNYEDFPRYRVKQRPYK